MENFTRAFTVSGNVITDSKPTKKAGNAGENIVTSLSFTFSSEWDNAIKSIVFKTPKNRLLTPQTITGSIAPIPQDALDSGGTLQFSLMGAFADSEQVIRTPTYGLDVESTLSILGGTPLATYTNVVLDCQLATQDAIDAKDLALSAASSCAATDATVQAAEGLRVIAETAREERADADHETAVGDHTAIAPTIVEVQTARGDKANLAERLDGVDASILDALRNILVLSGHKYQIVAGTVRNSGSGWEFIVDENHQADLNCISVSYDSTYITINYSGINGRKVVSFVVTPDESFAQSGYFCGATVAKTYAAIKIYKTIPNCVGGIATCTSYGFSLNSYNIGITSLAWDDAGKKLRINHADLGSFYSNSGAPVIVPYSTGKFIPRVVALSDKYADIEFFNFDGTKIETLSNLLSFSFSRGTGEQLAQSLVNPATLVNSGGNLWFMGIFEV